MRVGQRVEHKQTKDGGVVLTAQYGGSECYVLWNNDSRSWEMAEDLRVVPNKPGDSFLSSNNGFGVIVGEIHRPTINPRDNAATEAELFLRERFGLIVIKHPAQVSAQRQLTLDIRSRVSHGMPLKGGIGNKRPDKRKLGLAAVVATGEPVLVRKGRLRLEVTPRLLDSNKLPTRRADLSATARRLTLNQKRRLKAAKNRRTSK